MPDAPRSNPFIALFRSSSRDSSSGIESGTSTPDTRVQAVKLIKTASRDGSATPVSSPPRRKTARGAVDDPFPVYSSHASDYALAEVIGFGASSTVYLAKFRPLDLPCAVKVIDVDRLSVSSIDRLRRETQLMSLSKHPNVLRVRGEWLQGSKLYIAARLMSAGSLSDIMRYSHPNGFDETTIATILKQALEGLLYFHRNGWLHRDLKAGNMLVDEDGTVLLADFGVSSVLVASASDQKHTTSRKSFVGTPLYMAPEVIEQKDYDAKADVWSFGITALELSTGHAPHAFVPAAKVLQKTVLEAAPTVQNDGEIKFSKTFKDLVDSCLRKDPARRPTSEKLLSHPFFKQAKSKKHLVNTVLAGLPPLQTRQDRRRTASIASGRADGSWDFGTIHPARSGDPFNSFTGRHQPVSPPDSPHGSRFTDQADGAPIRSHGRTISFSVPEYDGPPISQGPTSPLAVVADLSAVEIDPGDAEGPVPHAATGPPVVLQTAPVKAKDKRTSRNVFGKLGFSS